MTDNTSASVSTALPVSESSQNVEAMVGTSEAVKSTTATASPNPPPAVKPLGTMIKGLAGELRVMIWNNVWINRLYHDQDRDRLCVMFVPMSCVHEEAKNKIREPETLVEVYENATDSTAEGEINASNAPEMGFKLYYAEDPELSEITMATCREDFHAVGKILPHTLPTYSKNPDFKIRFDGARNTVHIGNFSDILKLSTEAIDIEDPLTWLCPHSYLGANITKLSVPGSNFLYDIFDQEEKDVEVKNFAHVLLHMFKDVKVVICSVDDELLEHTDIDIVEPDIEKFFDHVLMVLDGIGCFEDGRIRPTLEFDYGLVEEEEEEADPETAGWGVERLGY